MKVLLATTGSRGDIQPLAVLGGALVRAGHTVTLAAPPDMQAFADERGLAFAPCGRDFTKYLAELDVAHINPIQVMREFKALVTDEIRTTAPVLFQAGRGCDLVVAAGLQPLALTAAEVNGAKSAYVYYAPSLLMSRDHPPMMIQNQRLPGFLNHWLHYGTMMFFDRAIMPVVNEVRAGQNLSAHPRFVEALPREILLGWDRAVAEAPSDYAAIAKSMRVNIRAHHVGSLVPDPRFEPSQTLDDEVTRFVDGGPCVYVGFGSMPDKNVETTQALVAGAAKKAGVRAVMLGRSLIRGDDLLVTGPLSHRALFPKMRAIVHHCGSGTTAAASRSGVPQVAVPHFVDQPLWAERLRARGVSAATIPRPKLDVDRLAAALLRCVEDKTLQERARALALELSATNPIERAVQTLEAIAYAAPDSGLGGARA